MEAKAGSPQGQPTGAILAALGLLLGSLDDPQKAELHDSQRWAAERAMEDLCSRYGLKQKRHSDEISTAHGAHPRHRRRDQAAAVCLMAMTAAWLML